MRNDRSSLFENVLSGAAVFTIALLMAAGCGGRSEPNLVLLTIDTLRPDRLGVYGSSETRTPVFDRLATEGTLFADCSSPVPSTSPSHASLLTGLYPKNHGLRENGALLGGEVPLLQESLRSAGYATAAFVSGFPLLGRFGFDRGFDDFDDFLSDGFTTGGGETRGTERIAEKTVDAFLRWEEKTDRPWFAWIHIFDPHSVYSAPDPFRTMYYRGDPRNPENRSLEGVDLPAYLMLRGVTDVEYPIALYGGEVTYADYQIGRLMRALRERGVLDETLFAVTADHGESLTEHDYYFGHSHLLYEPSLRVPLILRLPGKVPAGQIVSEPVSLLDLFDTFAELLGVTRPGGSDGRSVVPLIEGGDREEAALFHERPPSGAGPLFALRRGPWKYIRSDDGTEELYDLSADPRESRDLAPVERDRCDRMRSELLSWVDGGKRVDRPELDRETVEKLRILGYVD